MNLENFKIAVTSHVLTTGPTDKLIDYLKDRVTKIIYIGHPFSYAEKANSFYKIYEKNKCVKEHQFFIDKLPGVLNYIKDFLLTFFWMLMPEKQDLYIGIDNLNATCGILLKKIGRIKRVIFYTIDYMPKRFQSPILNSIYHAFDRFAVKHSDLVWNLSDRMVYEREKRGVPPTFRNKQIRVPVGTDLDFKGLENENRHPYDVAFMGHLREGQGLELLLDSFKDVLNKIPEAKLQIFGTGPLQGRLKKKSIDLKIASNVTFHGRIEDHNVLLAELAKCAVAVAPYEDSEENFTRYTDPGKPKAYLSAGLPVIITKVPEFSEEIEREACGKAIDYSKRQITEAIIELLMDEQKSSIFRKNIKKIVRKYEWSKIFDKSFGYLNK